MKKVLRIMGLCALVALAATSCKKDEQKLTSSFTAELTQPTGDAKTHLGSDSYLYWDNGDAIKVFDNAGTAYLLSTTDNNVKVATFTSEATLDANESYTAFYPAAATAKQDNEIRLTLPAAQTFAVGSFGNATYPMAAVNNETNFTFHSSCGLLAIPVKGTGNIGSIELTSKTAGENLTGQLRYDLDGNYLGFTGEGTTVTLDCGNIALDATNATTFYFVLPKDVFANGFKAVLKNGTTELYTLETALPNTIAAETIKLMPEVTVSVVAVTTDPIANVGYTDATVNGSYVAPTGMSVTEVGFHWGSNATNLDNTETLAAASTPFATTIDGLMEGTTYYYQAYAKNGTKEYTGATESFTTSITATAPSVTTDPTGYEPTATAGVVVCYGALESLDNITEYGICWSTESFSKATVTYVPSTNWNSGVFSASFEVTDGLTYYYRAYAINTANLTGYGEIQSFTPLSVPTVTTSEATAVTTTTATCGGSVTSYGGTTPTQYGICWSTSANPTISDSKLYTDGEPLDDFAFNMTGLTHSTTYHVRAYATNGVGTGYGEDVTFTTGTILVPTVTTSSTVSDLTDATATCGGTILNNGIISAYGISYSTDSNFATGVTNVAGTSMTGNDFTVALTGLSGSTTYYFRAYASNEAGTGYGDILNFTTLASAPEGAINSKFTINEAGQQVYFSKGNLQYIGSAATPYWQFAENQWDYFGTTTGQNSSNQTVDRDLFCWGTSGYNHGATSYQPWSTSTTNSQYYAYTKSTYNLYDQTGQADWGYNAIVNGGNLENSGWRTLTEAEWHYVLNTRSTSSGILWRRGTVNGVCGVILLPDNWSASYYALNSGKFESNIITADDWTNVLEPHGAVFLPAAGNRYGTSVANLGAVVRYWSSSRYNGNTANDLYIITNVAGVHHKIDRYYACSVRLARDAE